MLPKKKKKESLTRYMHHEENKILESRDAGGNDKGRLFYILFRLPDEWFLRNQMDCRHGGGGGGGFCRRTSA